MSQNILDYFARRHSGFLHGAGSRGTDHLIIKAGLEGNEKVLELGCGTGASLVRLKSLYPKLQLFGLDRSEVILAKCNERLQFCGLGSVSIQKVEEGTRLPFVDGQFDLVFVESVLAIQSSAQLDLMLTEIYRLLKSGGRLAMNETIWLPDIPQKEIERINAACLKYMGIIQSNGLLSNADAWQNKLRDMSFEVLYCERAARVKTGLGRGWRDFTSRLFSSWGKLSAIFNPHLRSQRRSLKAFEKMVFQSPQPHLDSYLFIAQKG